MKFQYLISMTERGHCVISFVFFVFALLQFMSEKVGIPVMVKKEQSLTTSVRFNLISLIYKSNRPPLGNSTCSHNDAGDRLFAGDGSGCVGILRHLQMKMQRAKWLSTKQIPVQVEKIRSRRIFTGAIIISFPLELFFPLRGKC